MILLATEIHQRMYCIKKCKATTKLTSRMRIRVEKLRKETMNNNDISNSNRSYHVMQKRTFHNSLPFQRAVSRMLLVPKL